MHSGTSRAGLTGPRMRPALYGGPRLHQSLMPAIRDFTDALRSERDRPRIRLTTLLC